MNNEFGGAFLFRFPWLLPPRFIDLARVQLKKEASNININTNINTNISRRCQQDTTPHTPSSPPHPAPTQTSPMATSLLALFTHHPPSSTRTTPSTILSLSQRSRSFLSPGTSHPDTPETWLVYENLLLTSLRSRDDPSARICLDRLTSRFGATNERVMALRGLYDEATASSRTDLEGILARYEELLSEDPTNIVCPPPPTPPQSKLDAC